MDATTLRDALTVCRDALAGPGGIRASIDPGTVQVPGAWVQLRELPSDSWTLEGPAELSAYVYLIAPDVGTPEALDVLSDLLSKAIPVLGAVNGPVTALALSLPHTSTPLPALQVPVALDL